MTAVSLTEPACPELVEGACPGCRARDRCIADLKVENARLRKQLEQTQRESKRQAAPFSKGDPEPKPKTPGRKKGRAYGKKGWRRPPERVDETHEAGIPEFCECGGEIEEDLDVSLQTQEDIVRKVVRRLFRIHAGTCKRCRRRYRGRHPLMTSNAVGAAGAMVGPEAQTLAAKMNKELGVSHGKIVRFLEDAYGLSLSRGGSAQMVLRVARRSERTFQDILIVVRNSATVRADETGWKVAGLLQWLWTFVADAATLYLIRPSRGHDVIVEALGMSFDGRIVRDGLATYDHEVLSRAVHQLCLAHPLRRCHEMLKVATGGAVRFPREVKRLLQDALALRDRHARGEVSDHGRAVALGWLRRRLEWLLMWTKTNEANERLRKHLAQHEEHLFTFLREEGVEATNWPAEQAIRPAVVNRKVWGGNRTERGAHAQEVLVSVLRTCARSGVDAFEFLCQTLRAPPGTEPRLFAAPRVAGLLGDRSARIG